MITIKRIKSSLFDENCYIVYKQGSLKCVLIDPGSDYTTIKSTLNSLNLSVEGILLTHAHIDHCNEVHSFENIPVYLTKDELIVVKNNEEIDTLFGIKYHKFGNICTISNNIVLHLADMDIKVILTPGHTIGSCCYLFENYLFTGDTLFQGNIGRTDLFSADFNVYMDTLKNKVLVLNRDYIVLPGHGESTTIGNEQDVLDRFI